MKKVLSYIFIALGLVVMVISTSKPAMEYITNKRCCVPAWWAARQTQWGDLVRMSYLDDIKKFREPVDYHFTKAADKWFNDMDLYMWGDSYLIHVPDSVYARVHSYNFGRRGYYNLLYRELDSTKANILIIELSERFVRGYFNTTEIYNGISKGNPREALIKDDTDREAILFNKNINQNIEYNLFNYIFLDPIRKAKANLNYKLFHRAAGDVVVSDNGEHLFFKETIDNTKSGSYTPIDSSEVYHIVNILNETYMHYRKQGFLEVYLSIIPNPASILQPEGYNNLVPLIQNDPGLKMPVLDVYNKFKAQSDPSSVYRAGDTHWNNKGFQIWLNMVNEELRKF